MERNILKIIQQKLPTRSTDIGPGGGAIVANNNQKLQVFGQSKTTAPFTDIFTPLKRKDKKRLEQLGEGAEVGFRHIKVRGKDGLFCTNIEED